MNKRSTKKIHSFRILWLSAVALLITASFIVNRNTISANDKPALQRPAARPVSSPDPTPEAAPQRRYPQSQIYRIKIVIGEVRDIIVLEKAVSLVVVSPEIATAQIKQSTTFTVTGLKVGETMLIATDGKRRSTYLIEVTGRPRQADRPNAVSDADRFENENGTSGSYTVLYAQGFHGSPSLVRQNIDLRRKLSGNRVLRVTGELFNLVGKSNPDLALASVRNFGLNRLAVGIDSPHKTIDLLDSEIYLSPLSLNNFTIRGFHLVTTKDSPPGELPKKGIEVFAGFARPSLSFYDKDGGKVAGVILPVASGSTWQVRAGLITISRDKNARGGQSGTIALVTGSYAPNQKVSTDGEMMFANGEVSWRARLDLKFRRYGAYGEVTRLGIKSPLNSIGAQPGGRKTESLAFYWRPGSRFDISTRYQHTAITRVINSGQADFERSIFSANANYRISKNSRFNLRFTDQQIETAIPGSTEKFDIGTRTVTLGHSLRVSRNWTNNFEARINSSTEKNSDAGLETGLSLIERLRYSWKRNSVVAFVNYNYKTPSLSDLIVRNPRLLPPLLQQAYFLDPALFLQTYRDQLTSLLFGINLPQTRNLNTGVSLQTSFSRFNLAGEIRYDKDEILSQNQNNISASAALGVRLDAANSFQVNAWQSFGSTSQSGIAFSYTHHFGAGSGGGLQFSKLFGFGRGKIEGRVYFDLNGNGQDDPDEPGAVGVVVRVDENRSVKTDVGGNYQLSAGEGKHMIGIASEEIGVRLRASTPAQQKISLRAGRTSNVSFGLIDFGSARGHVLNDASLAPGLPVSDLAGLKGIRITLRRAGVIPGEVVAEVFTDGNGIYEFRGLRPGKYLAGIDAVTLPANFRIPEQMSWPVEVEALREANFDISLAAQRAITGVVFIDNDGNGKFDPQKDEPVMGALIKVGENITFSDSVGGYILRNLAAGRNELTAGLMGGSESSKVIMELPAEPVTLRGINVAIKR